MVTKTEGNYISDVVKYEADNHYSRDLITVASGAGVLKIGTVLGKVTASGKYEAADPVAATGEEVAVAVLLEDVDATSADVTEVVALVRHAVVNRNNLVWGATIDDSTKRATAVGELEAVGILAREGA